METSSLVARSKVPDYLNDAVDMADTVDTGDTGDTGHTVKPLSLVVLEGPTRSVRRLIFISGFDLLLLSCNGSHDDYVYDIPLIPSVSTRSVSVLAEGIAILLTFVGTLARPSFYKTRTLFTWHAATNRIIASLDIPTRSFNIQKHFRKLKSKSS